MLRKTEEKAKEKKALLSVSVSSARLQVTSTATAFATFSFFPSGLLFKMDQSLDERMSA